MSRRIPTCPECGCICGHRTGCPEAPDDDVREDREPDFETILADREEAQREGSIEL